MVGGGGGEGECVRRGERDKGRRQRGRGGGDASGEDLTGAGWVGGWVEAGR